MEEEPLGIQLLRAWGPLTLHPQLGRVLLHWEPEALGEEVVVGLGRLPVEGFVVWIGDDLDGVLLTELPEEEFETPVGVILLAALGDLFGAWNTYWGVVVPQGSRTNDEPDEQSPRGLS